MRNTGTRGYQGYRGRRPNGRRWLVLALILVILAATAFLLAQRYLVYDTDGSYHFELPWSRRGAPVPEPPEEDGSDPARDLEIVIERTEASKRAESAPRAHEPDGPGGGKRSSYAFNRL